MLFSLYYCSKQSAACFANINCLSNLPQLKIEATHVCYATVANILRCYTISPALLCIWLIVLSV